MKKFLMALFCIFVLVGCELDTEDTFDQNLDDTQDNDQSPDTNHDDSYFEVLELEYNGPKLDSKYFSYTSLYTGSGDERKGTGIAFEVTLKSNTDGDTAWFNVPDKYSEYYTSSFRFLNMDTEETYGTPEEWGKPASAYTASLLDNAYSIVLQNDTGDDIVDYYNRGLVWVWVKMSSNSDYELLNYKVLQQGLGSVAYLYGAGEMLYNNITYTNWMYQAENEAKTNKRGMHSDLLDPYWDYDNNTLLSYSYIDLNKENYIYY